MQTDVGQPTNQPAVPRSVSRRTVLQFLGLGAGVVAVATGLTRRAVDGGVSATGTGPAYAAWDQADPTGQDPLNLVRAAILAANAHNTQPWLFTVTGDRIKLFADMSRTIGAMDPLLREMHISLGRALENRVLAGPPSGLTATAGTAPAGRTSSNSRTESPSTRPASPTSSEPWPSWCRFPKSRTTTAGSAVPGTARSRLPPRSAH